VEITANIRAGNYLARLAQMARALNNFDPVTGTGKMAQAFYDEPTSFKDFFQQFGVRGEEGSQNAAALHNLHYLLQRETVREANGSTKDRRALLNRALGTIGVLVSNLSLDFRDEEGRLRTLGGMFLEQESPHHGYPFVDIFDPKLTIINQEGTGISKTPTQSKRLDFEYQDQKVIAVQRIEPSKSALIKGDDPVRLLNPPITRNWPTTTFMIYGVPSMHPLPGSALQKTTDQSYCVLRIQNPNAQQEIQEKVKRLIADDNGGKKQVLSTPEESEINFNFSPRS